MATKSSINLYIKNRLNHQLVISIVINQDMPNHTYKASNLSLIREMNADKFGQREERWESPTHLAWLLHLLQDGRLSPSICCLSSLTWSKHVQPSLPRSVLSPTMDIDASIVKPSPTTPSGQPPSVRCRTATPLSRSRAPAPTRHRLRLGTIRPGSVHPRLRNLAPQARCPLIWW
jgi:hypothetical protein